MLLSRRVSVLRGSMLWTYSNVKVFFNFIFQNFLHHYHDLSFIPSYSSAVVFHKVGHTLWCYCPVGVIVALSITAEHFLLFSFKMGISWGHWVNVLWKDTGSISLGFWILKSFPSLSFGNLFHLKLKPSLLWRSSRIHLPHLSVTSLLSAAPYML